MALSFSSDDHFYSVFVLLIVFLYNYLSIYLSSLKNKKL